MIRSIRIVGCSVLATGLVAGCASSTTGPPLPTRKPAASTTTMARSDARVPDAECSDAPPGGELTQALDGLSFRTGSIRVLIRPLAPPPPPNEAPQPADADSEVDGCFAFPKWGNVDPVVPVESALFVFKDARSNGAQIEMSLSELVSRQAMLAAQIGVAARGRYYQGISCTMRVTALTTDRAAGEFTCPSAVLLETNPFFPSDDIDASDLSPGPSAPASQPAPQPPAASAPVTVPTVALSGWFETQR